MNPKTTPMKTEDYKIKTNKMTWNELREEARKQFALNKTLTIIAATYSAVIILGVIAILIF